MPSAPALPLAVDLDVTKVEGQDVTLDDVETAAYALTGWQAPQHLVQQLLDVVEAYARGARAGRVPRRLGHDPGKLPVRAPVACGRAHLDEHTCPVTVKTVEVEVPVPAALDEAAKTVAPAARAPRVGIRNEPTMTPGELILVPDTEVDQLTDAQRMARHVLMTRSQGCSTCGVVKALDEFYRDKARLTGHASRCKDCANAASAARRRAKTP
jgi:hypothetical protein